MATNPVLQALIDEAKKLGDQAIQALISVLGGDRSVVLIVSNNTSHTLTAIANEHSHGGFQHPPDPVIPPKSASGFTSRSSGFLTGTEGSVTYASDDGKFTFTVSWDNPWRGSNSSNASVSGVDCSRYLPFSETGNGNTAAQMLYFLFVHPDSSVKDSLKGKGDVSKGLRSFQPGAAVISVRNLVANC